MLVPVRGVAVNVGQQTGDGRYIVPGGIEWATLPLPFAWLVDGDQHADMTEMCPQIGTMNTLAAVGGDVRWTGFVDDAIPVGLEFLRRMREGSASLGPRFGVSIDPDNYAVQIVDTTVGPEGMLIMASAGEIPTGQRFDWNAPLRGLMRARMIDALAAAAGDGDPLTMGGQVVWEDAVDSIIQRYTRLRVRGLTACAVAAFTDCYVELDDGSPFDGAPATSTTEGQTSGVSIVVNTTATTDGLTVEEPPVPSVEVVPVVAASAPARVEVNLSTPPAAWFEDPGLHMPSPLTITNEGRVLGHIAAWGTCHTGYTERCVTPPRGDYDSFHVGATRCSDGSEVATGVFAWGIPHAALTQSLIDAWSHYSDSRYGFARVASGEDAHGIWFSGALMPGITESDIAILRALSMSGDWRRNPRTRRLSLIAALAVNFPGYPIPRATSITAASGEVIDVESWETPEATMQLDGDEIVALIACGRLAPRALMSDCGCGDGAEVRMSQVEARLARAERLLQPLLGIAAGEVDKLVLPAAT